MTLDERRRRYLAELGARYLARSPRSVQAREGSYPALADARSSQGYSARLPPEARALWLASKQLRHPIVGERSAGAQIWDIDGNAYIDFCMGFGVHLFGHRPAFIEDAVRAQLARGLPIGLQSPRANAVATTIAALTGAERVAICNTGAEANMGAIRLARAATGRDRIAVFAGSYHGSHDAVVPSIAQTRGLSTRQLEDTLVLEYGAAASLETIAAQASTLAAVLVEAVQARNLELPSADFLRGLRELTAATGVSLIIDDVLLGFRVHPGGSQAYFDVRADLATFGKVIGGGLPIGVITGDARHLDAIDGGRWSAHDDSAPGGDKVWLAGTFSKNPLTMAAAAAVGERLLGEGPTLQAALNAKTARLCAALDPWLVAQDMPLRLVHFGSLFRLVGPPWLWPVMAELRLRGIFAFDGMTFFVSTAHDDVHLQQFRDALRDSLTAMRQGGYFD